LLVPADALPKTSFGTMAQVHWYMSIPLTCRQFW
jgi:hypothetical protein